MAIDWGQLAVNSVPGLAAAVLSAALSAKWALARFRSERWWERKVETYTDITRALFLVKRYVDAWVDDYESRIKRTEEFNQRLLDDWHLGSRAVDEATVIGSFIISEEAARVLAQLRREKASCDPDDSYDQATTEAAALERAIRAFTGAARRDIGIRFMGSFASELRRYKSLRLSVSGQLCTTAPTHRFRHMVLPIVDIDRLTVGERLALIEQVWDSLRRGAGVLPLSDVEGAVIDARREEHRVDPDAAVAWESVRNDLLDDQEADEENPRPVRG